MVYQYSSLHSIPFDLSEVFIDRPSSFYLCYYYSIIFMFVLCYVHIMLNLVLSCLSFYSLSICIFCIFFLAVKVVVNEAYYIMESVHKDSADLCLLEMVICNSYFVIFSPPVHYRIDLTSLLDFSVVTVSVILCQSHWYIRIMISDGYFSPYTSLATCSDAMQLVNHWWIFIYLYLYLWRKIMSWCGLELISECWFVKRKATDVRYTV